MPNYYGLFFSRDEQVIRLPFNPEKLPVTRDTDNDEYNVLGIGPIMVPRLPNLRTVTISSFFPGRPFSGVLTPNGFLEPEFYISFFENAMRDKAVLLYTPVRYYEDGTPFLTGDSGFPVLVTSFSTEERGGETGDFYYDLTLTEYRDYTPLTMQVQQQTGSGGTQTTVATTTPERDVPSGQLYVGAVCTANGDYFYSSYGDTPSYHASGRRVVVSRIVDATRPYPVHVTTESGGALGWMSKDSLQVVST